LLFGIPFRYSSPRACRITGAVAQASCLLTMTFQHSARPS